MTTANDLRQMNSEELTRMLSEQREALFNLRLKLRTGHLENTASLGAARKDIARLETLLREQQLGIAHAIKAAPAAREAASAGESKTKAAKGKAASAKAPKAARAHKKDG